MNNPSGYFFDEKFICFFPEEPTHEELLRFVKEQAKEGERKFSSVVLVVGKKALIYYVD